MPVSTRLPLLAVVLAVGGLTLSVGCGCPAGQGPGPARPCAAGGAAGPKVVLTGDDDVAATTIFAEFLKQNGFQIIKQEPKAVAVRYKGVGAILLPKIYANDQIDRIIVTRIFGPKQEYRGRPEINQLALELNDKLNIAQYWVHSDGNLMATTHITFVDELTLAELDAFFVWLGQSTRQMVRVVPRAAELLE
jgi:hypothetical protein